MYYFINKIADYENEQFYWKDRSLGGRLVPAGMAALAVSCTGMVGRNVTQGECFSYRNPERAGPVSKAVGSPDDAEAVKEAENKLHNVTVFVFNSNGTLDKKHTFAPNQISETITGLVAGTKKVVVVANVRQRLHFRTASITVGLKMPVM